MMMAVLNKQSLQAHALNSERVTMPELNIQTDYANTSNST